MAGAESDALPAASGRLRDEATGVRGGVDIIVRVMFEQSSPRPASAGKLEYIRTLHGGSSRTRHSECIRTFKRVRLSGFFALRKHT
jgi:hypothetical protein